jgi:YidC/Oxa1 family membrane protein insertase
VIVFIFFCGWLVLESGLFDDTSQTGHGFILLQNVTVDEEAETPNEPVPEGEQPQASDSIKFTADNAPARTITLGSVDPESGYKYKLELSSKGAAIAKGTYSEFNDRDHKDPQPLVIISPMKERDGSEFLSMANTNFVFVEQGLQLPLDRLLWKSYDVETAQDGSQTARFEAIIKRQDTGEPVIKLTKTYKISRDSYLLDCDITVENLGDVEQKVRFDLIGPGGLGREAFRTDMRKIVGGFALPKAKQPEATEVVSSRQGIQSSGFIRKKLGIKDALAQYHEALRTGDKNQIELARENLQIQHNLPDKYRHAHFLWAATVNKYFAAILVPLPDQDKKYCDWVMNKTGRFHNPDGDNKGDSGDETIGFDFKIASNTLAETGQADSSRTYKFQLYLGPKDKSLFDKNPLYKKYGFFQTIEFMSCCCPANIIKPLAFGILALMKWMYGFWPHNYGIVIIILVFLMRLVMHPITKKSQVSMSKMSTLAPKAEEIKKKYANNKAEMNKQMMALYREQGASPVMGFLPMMVQMPIWIALWSAVYTSIDLRGAAFLPFWITDLSMPDALIRFSTLTVPLVGWKIESLNLLPLLMGVAFYLQQQLMPTQANASTNPQMAQQQKMMKIMMPLLFPLMLYKAPSGVSLYIMASTFAGVIEQHVIRKHIREKEEAESKGLVAATSKTGGKVKKKKPKPFFKT